MNLLAELKKAKRGDVVYFKPLGGETYVCLVYGTDANAIELAAPGLGKDWHALNARFLSVVIQNGKPLFED
jgi:hypothetical protein